MDENELEQLELDDPTGEALAEMALLDGAEDGRNAENSAAGDHQPFIKDSAPRGNGERAVRPRRRRTRPIEVALLAVSLALLVSMCLLLGGVFGLAGSVSSLFSTTGNRSAIPSGSFSIISVEGTIASGNSSGYQHSATVTYVRRLRESDNNEGILLYLNTSGGGLYESDELYRELMRYKEETGRPIWAYMGRYCASGGYYIAAAADYIIANPGATTGSIGVYYQLTDTSGLYGMLGVETVLVRSGDNKGIGVDGVEITPENRAVYQSMVDESYEIFVELIAESRGMTIAETEALADGRPYTARQALANGLVDELGEWPDIKERFAEETGASEYNTSFTSTTALRSLLGGLFGRDTQSDSQALLQLAESQQSGLMATAEGLG